MPLSVAEAAALVVDVAKPVETERITLGTALDRVLAEPVPSPIALPPWDNASMDGYAIHSGDATNATENAPITLPVVRTIPAGGSGDPPLDAGAAARIMTGAPVPVGADSVIRIEDTDGGTERVTIRDTRDVGRNIRRRGEEIRPGEIAVPKGSVLGPAQLGVLASVGAAEVWVYRRPRVALLVTGDEIVDLDRFAEVADGRRIISSNSYSLRAAIEQTGADVDDLGRIPDDEAALTAALRNAIERGCDLIVTTGGVSVGAFDYTRGCVRAIGGTVAIDRIRMRPGAPLGFGSIGTTMWLGLPGNPVSALVTFEIFGRAILRRLRGEQAYFPVPLPTVTDSPLTLGGRLTHFLRAVAGVQSDSRLHAELTGAQGSGMLTSVSRANALLIVPADRGTVAAGETLSAVLTRGHGLLSDRFDVE